MCSMENQQYYSEGPDSMQLKEFQCPVCLKNFSRKFTLDMHLLIHKGVKPHPCPFCGKHFRQKGTLMRHKALHSASNLFHCSLCNRGFRQKNVFLHHLKHRHHVSTESLDRRKHRTELKDYQKIMDTLPPFVSADSTAIASSEKHLDAMLFESLNNDICDSSVTESSVTEGQVYQMTNSYERTGVEELRYECGICSKVFFDYSFYENHVEEEHGDVENLLDNKPIITQSFTQVNSTSSQTVNKRLPHFASDNASVTLSAAQTKTFPFSNTSSLNGNRKICVTCQKMFSCEKDLESHLKTHEQNALLKHSNVNSAGSAKDEVLLTPSQCQSQIMSGDQNAKFRNSLGLTTTTTKPISLRNPLNMKPFNDKQFTKDTYSLISKPRANRNQVCSLPDLAPKAGYIKRHNSLDIVSPKPKKHVRYGCRKCCKSFLSKTLLEYHKQMHLNSQAFGCTMCKKGFSSKQSLLSHTRTAHLESFKCQSCSRVFQYRTLYNGHVQNCIDAGPKLNENLKFPLVSLRSVLNGDVDGIVGVIPTATGSSDAVIPIVSIESLRRGTGSRFRYFEVSGSYQDLAESILGN